MAAFLSVMGWITNKIVTPWKSLSLIVLYAYTQCLWIYLPESLCLAIKFNQSCHYLDMFFVKIRMQQLFLWIILHLSRMILLPREWMMMKQWWLSQYHRINVNLKDCVTPVTCHLQWTMTRLKSCCCWLVLPLSSRNGSVVFSRKSHAKPLLRV